MEHPRLAPGLVEDREYQRTLAEVARRESTLLVLPTGLGKTVVAVRLIAEILAQEGGPILFLAPTKPLAAQHRDTLVRFLSDPDVILLTGEISPKKRQGAYAEHEVVVATPQVVFNDLVAERIDLDLFRLVIFDEAHRAVGEYAYVPIAAAFQGRVLGMTASPGSEPEAILERCRILGIGRLEIRTETDPDVMPYVHEINIDRVFVDVPEDLGEVIDTLKELLKEDQKFLVDLGVMPRSRFVKRGDLLEAARLLKVKMNTDPSDSSVYDGMARQARAMKVAHLQELAETQGSGALRAGLARLAAEAGKRRSPASTRMLVEDHRFQRVVRLANEAEEVHPKAERVVAIIRSEMRRNKDLRILLFAHYRDTAVRLTEALSDLPGVRPVRFVGQGHRGEDRGLSQKEQGAILAGFRAGESNVLVATSVAEEGLDIPAMDLVIFYEPVPNEIRLIQRRGRTGRQKVGRVIILITRKTRDEAYLYVSRYRENRMLEELRSLQHRLRGGWRFGAADTSGSKGGGGTLGTGETPGAGGTLGAGATLGSADPPGNVDTTGSSGIPRDGSIQVALPSAAEVGADEDAARPTPQKVLTEYRDEGPALILDDRELRSAVAQHLREAGIRLVPARLSVGDYVVSADIGVERKTTEDFLASLLDGRLFDQAARLSEAYRRPLILLEGGDLYTRRRIDRGAITGALLSLTTRFRIPVLQTEDAAETARFLVYAFRKEVERGKRPQVRGELGFMDDRERLIHLVAGFPDINVTLAKRLLGHFGTLRAIANANIGELMEVEGVGRVTAKELKRLARLDFRKL